MVFEALRLTVVGYLLLVAAAAVFGMHRALLFYPLHAGYAVFRLLVLLLTFGRVRFAPVARTVGRRQKRRARNMRTRFSDWQERRAEEHARDQGDEVFAGGWTSSTPENSTVTDIGLPVLADEPELYADIAAPPVPSMPSVAPAPASATPSAPVPAPSPPTPPMPTPPMPPSEDEEEGPPSLW